MKVYLIGVGLGNPDTLTAQALRAIEESAVLIGAPRLLEPWAGRRTLPLVRPADQTEIKRLLRVLQPHLGQFFQGKVKKRGSEYPG